MICDIQNITVSLDKQPILKNLTWQLTKGEVIGLLGKNGAGKSTLIRSILGLIVPTHGTIDTFGVRARDLGDAQKDKLAYVPQTAMGYESLRVAQALSVHSACYSRWDSALAERMLNRFEIDNQKRVSALSVGQRQLLMLVFALPTNPQFLIMDEPFASLDPSARREVLQFVSQLCQEDTTILYSTHLTADLNRLATRVALLAHGQIAMNEPMDLYENTYLFLGHPSEFKALEKEAKIIKQDATKTLFFANDIDLELSPAIQKLNLEEFFIYWHQLDGTEKKEQAHA